MYKDKGKEELFTEKKKILVHFSYIDSLSVLCLFWTRNPRKSYRKGKGTY